MEKSKIYTRTGDTGGTSLIGGVRCRKTDIRIEAYGTIDELNAQIGHLVTMIPEGEQRTLLERTQYYLFSIGTYLATDQTATKLSPLADVPPIATEHLEDAIDRMEDHLEPLKGFVIPGGTKQAAKAHICRTVCRRAERRVAAMANMLPVDPEILKFLNRLSDYLFVLSRKLNFNARCEEKLWPLHKK